MKKTQTKKVNFRTATQAQIKHLLEENKKLSSQLYDTSAKAACDAPKTDVYAENGIFRSPSPVERKPVVLILTPEDQNSQILDTAFKSFEICISKLKSKTKDYARTYEEFSNFNDAEMQLEFDRIHGLDTKVPLYDATALSIRNLIKTKTKRFLNLTTKQSAPLNESIDDTVVDLINYLVIYQAWKQKG